jgi:hypothetical protein
MPNRGNLWNKIVLVGTLGLVCSACPRGAVTTPSSDGGATPPPDAGTSARTAFEHALACEAQLGPVPAFDLTTATEIPVTQNGAPVSGGQAQACDHPAAFQAPCEPGLLGRLPGKREDGSEDPDVLWTYIVRSGGFAAIGYHQVTGATCFLEIDALPDNTAILESPSTVTPDAYNAQWTSPQEMFEVSRCQDCHMADPFLHSPYIDQVRHPDDPDKPLIPIISGASNPRPPYQIVSSPTQPYTTELPGNSCTSCHRPQCTTLFDGQNGYALDELAMPAPFHDLSTWDDPTSVADRAAVRDWCNTLTPFGPQLGGGGDGTDDDDEDNGPCDLAFDCASECPVAGYDCARSCGSRHLTGAPRTTFTALVGCAEAVACEVSNLECLDTSCEAEFEAFISACGED